MFSLPSMSHEHLEPLTPVYEKKQPKKKNNNKQRKKTKKNKNKQTNQSQAHFISPFNFHTTGNREIPFSSLLSNVTGRKKEGLSEVTKQPQEGQARNANGHPSKPVAEKFTYHGDSVDQSQDNVQVMISLCLIIIIIIIVKVKTCSLLSPPLPLHTYTKVF